MDKVSGVRKEAGEVVRIGLRRCGVKHPELGLLCSRKASGDFGNVSLEAVCSWGQSEVRTQAVAFGGLPLERHSLEQGWRLS